MQARERAYRIGQQRPVTVYRLVTAGTLERRSISANIKQVLSQRAEGPEADAPSLQAARPAGTVGATEFSNSDGTGTDMFANAGISQRLAIELHPRLISVRSRCSGCLTAHVDSASSSVAAQTVRREPPATLRPSGATSSGGASASLHWLGIAPSAQPTVAAQTGGAETDFLSQLLRGELSLARSTTMRWSVTQLRPRRIKRSRIEAKRVAERAAASLRDSFEQRRRDRLNVPTWTGRNGGAASSRRFGSP